jgi:hypothetical protein
VFHPYNVYIGQKPIKDVAIKIPPATKRIVSIILETALVEYKMKNKIAAIVLTI